MESIALFTWDCFHQGTSYDLEIAISHRCFVCCIPPGKSKVCVMLVFTDIISWICCHLRQIWNDIHRFQFTGSITHEQNVKTQMMPRSFRTDDELQPNFYPDEPDKSHWSLSTAAVRRVKGPSTKCNTEKKTKLSPKCLHTSVVSRNFLGIFCVWSKLCDITLHKNDTFFDMLWATINIYNCSLVWKQKQQFKKRNTIPNHRHANLLGTNITMGTPCLAKYGRATIQLIFYFTD